MHKYSILTHSMYLNKNYFLIEGNYGIKSLATCFIRHQYLERLRRNISKQFKRLEKKRFKIYFRIFIWQCYTKKPTLSRMGKGVGSVDSWVALVKMGLIFLEIFSLKSKYIVQGIVLKAIKYVPFKVQFVSLS
jgi:large subunit ribosomal protein L16